MTIVYQGEEGLVSKPTRFLTRSPEVAKRLAKTCSPDCKKQNNHIAVWGSRAREAQRYPRNLCRAVVAGVKAEKMRKETNLCEIDIDVVAELECLEINEIVEDIEARHESELQQWSKAWDDVTGKSLNPKEVVKARAQEMQYVHDLKVYEIATVDECHRVTGRVPIKSRWIDINKGDDSNPNYRSRWVAKEFRTNDDFELFAATPPLDALRYIISTAASMKNGSLMSNDVSRAFFYAPVKKGRLRRAAGGSWDRPGEMRPAIEEFIRNTRCRYEVGRSIHLHSSRPRFQGRC